MESSHDRAALTVRSLRYHSREYLVTVNNCALVVECGKMGLRAAVQQKSHWIGVRLEAASRCDRHKQARGFRDLQLWSQMS